MQCLCLGSKAFFVYNPTDTEIVNYIAQKLGKKADSISFESQPSDLVEEARRALLEAEEKLPMQEKKA